MDCKDFREKLFLYPEVDEEFYNHLYICPSCREKLENWIKIEERLREPIFQEEIDLEWIKVSKEINRKITWERYKRGILLGILTFLGIILSLIFFILVYRPLNLPLIFWGLSTIFREISKSLSPLIVVSIILLATKSELDTRIFKNGSK